MLRCIATEGENEEILDVVKETTVWLFVSNSCLCKRRILIDCPIVEHRERAFGLSRLLKGRTTKEIIATRFTFDLIKLSSTIVITSRELEVPFRSQLY